MSYLRLWTHIYIYIYIVRPVVNAMPREATEGPLEATGGSLGGYRGQLPRIDFDLRSGI